MHSKIILSTVLTGFIFFTGTVEAYDLPKIRVDTKITETKPSFKSDWTNFEQFEQKLRIKLAENNTLPPSSQERINNDKNQVFVAFYKGNAYFLDRYSIKIVKDTTDKQSWRQHIFPIGQNISSKNTKATIQKFSTDGENMYNSFGRKNDLDAVIDDIDRDFLIECFKVGYYYAFGKDFDKI